MLAHTTGDAALLHREKRTTMRRSSIERNEQGPKRTEALHTCEEPGDKEVAVVCGLGVVALEGRLRPLLIVDCLLKVLPVRAWVGECVRTCVGHWHVGLFSPPAFCISPYSQTHE